MKRKSEPSQGEALQPRPRYHLLDELRGVAILFMVAYHGIYLLSDVFGHPFWQSMLARVKPIQPLIAGTFILLCGLCCQFSRSNGKRGLRLLAAGLLLTFCTWVLTFFGIHEFIVCGVLHFLGCAVLLFALLQKPLSKLPPLPQLLVFLLLFSAFASPLYGGPRGLGFGSWLLPFPVTRLLPLFVLGFPSTIGSADYIPLLPWLFLFFAGTALGIYGKQGRFPPWAAASRSTALQWLGKHSLLIYLLHQPVLFVLVKLFQLIAQRITT